jgi:hypothetical protein
VTNLTLIKFLFRLWIVNSQPIESTLHFDVTEQATVCTDSDNSLAPLCNVLSVCFNEYIYMEPSLKENRLVGYEYVNEKAGK